MKARKPLKPRIVFVLGRWRVTSRPMHNKNMQSAELRMWVRAEAFAARLNREGSA